MSIIETLTEGMVHRDMQKEGAALLNKWTATGLLEGLSNDNDKHNMARLLENQAKELLRESTSMAGGQVEGFAAVAFPIVRRVFAGLIANDLVSVQPMSLPSGLIFFMDFTYGDELNGSTATDRFGNAVSASIYGTDKVGSGVIDGVNLAGQSLKEDLSGPGRAGSVGYAFASPEGSNKGNLTVDTHIELKESFLISTATDAQKKLVQYDADLLSLQSGELAIVIDIIGNQHSHTTAGTPDADFDNLSAFVLDPTEMITFLNLRNSGGTWSNTSISNTKQVRRLTKKVNGSDTQLSGVGANVRCVRYVLVTDGSATVTATTTASGFPTAYTANKLFFPTADVASASANASAGALDAFQMLLENTGAIPEIDIKVDSTAITAQTKKLKAKWTPELGQDLNAYHNLDAEVELTSILSEQIALELDREILADLVNGATAATYYWSRSPGLFVDRVSGAELGATSAAPDFTGTVSEWYETLIETINDVSAQIHRKTLRGGANFVVCGPEVANILEFTAGFRANVTADADKGDIGAVKSGSLNRKFDVVVDPYFPRNAILVGRKGNSFLESGYVYAPYVPLQTTPTIFGPEDFVPRKGVMTRYAKKMVRPDMYGLVIVRGLLGESGS